MVNKIAFVISAVFLMCSGTLVAQAQSAEVRELCSDFQDLMDRVADLDGAKGVQEFETKSADTVNFCKSYGLYTSPTPAGASQIAEAEKNIAELEAENRQLCLETTDLVAQLLPLGGISAVLEAEQKNASLIQSCTEDGLYQRPEQMRSFEASCRDIKGDLADEWPRLSTSQKNEYRTQAAELIEPCQQLGVSLFPSN